MKVARGGILDWTSAGRLRLVVEEKESMPGFHRIPCLLSFVAIAVASVGCVGPRVPSDRYLQEEAHGEFHAPETISSQPSMCDLDEGEPPKEIPWPMFHPIPTRPVFGGSGL